MTTPDPTPATALPTLGDPGPVRPLPRATLISVPPPPPSAAPPGALASLILGILSLVGCGLPVVGLVLGIAALICAGQARAAARAAPTRYLPSGLAAGGLVTGIIGTVLGTLVILFWATVLLLLVALAGMVASVLGHHAPTALHAPVL